MNTKTIKIGNMCCSRCIVVVKQTLTQLEIKHKKVELGFAVIHETKTFNEANLESALRKAGFKLIKTKEEEICEKIKIAIHKIFNTDALEDISKFNLKEHLEIQTKLPYKNISEVFSKTSNKTIEKYFIAQRIEKVKAMIHDTHDSFSEIAYKVGYKSLSYLSRQFKLIEGLSMHDYKLKHHKSRKSIDKL